MADIFRTIGDGVYGSPPSRGRLVDGVPIVALYQEAAQNHIAGMLSRMRLNLRDWYVKGARRGWRFHLSEIFRVLSYVLFLLSLIAVAFNRARGYQVLLYGPLGLLWFSVNWPWLGNPALFAAWVSLAKRANITAAVFSTAALVAAARFFLVPKLIFESGIIDKLEYLGPGFWLWSASMVCALLAALIRLSMPKPGFYEEDD